MERFTELIGRFAAFLKEIGHLLERAEQVHAEERAQREHSGGLELEVTSTREAITGVEQVGPAQTLITPHLTHPLSSSSSLTLARPLLSFSCVLRRPACDSIVPYSSGCGAHLPCGSVSHLIDTGVLIDRATRGVREPGVSAHRDTLKLPGAYSPLLSAFFARV
jgi:hypothetical protein